MTEEASRGAVDAARARLLDAAEQHIARSGLEAVSLRQVARDAGHRNTGAVRYHFGTLDGMVEALVARHRAAIDSARAALLDQLELTAAPDLRSYAAALVQPLGSKLDDESGRCFLALAAQLVNRPDTRGTTLLTQGEGNTLQRWRTAVEPHLPEGAVLLHSRFNAIQFGHTEMARQARRGPPGSHRLLVISRVTDVVASILSTPLTEETRRLLSPRTQLSSEPLAEADRLAAG